MKKYVKIIAIALATVAVGTAAYLGLQKSDPYLKAAQEKIYRSSEYFDPPATLHANPWAPPATFAALNHSAYENLFEYSPAPEKIFYPVLGESFEVLGNSVVINLKKGVKWTDGVEFTAKDVITTVNLGFIGGWPIWNYLEKIEAKDDYTVVFTFEQMNSIAPVLATNFKVNSPYHIFGKWSDELEVVIANRTKMEDGSWDEATKKAADTIKENLFEFKPPVTDTVGTGPFKLVNVTTSEAVFEKNKDYWNADKVQFEKAVFNRYTSIEAYLNNIMSKAYDIEPHGLAPDAFKEVEAKNPEMRIAWHLDLGQPSFLFNMSKYPLNIPEVRKAILYATNREALIPIAEPGTFPGDVYAIGTPPVFRDTFYDQSFLDTLEKYEYNTEKAEELLKSIGWSKKDNAWHNEKGELIELEVASMNSWPIFFICGDALANQLNEFGLKTTFKAMELSAYWQYVDNQNGMITCEFRGSSQTYGVPWESFKGLLQDGAIRLGLRKPDALVEEGESKNVVLTTTDSKEYDITVLLQQLLNETDEAKQQELSELMATIVNDQAVFMPWGEKYAPSKVHNPYMVIDTEDQNMLYGHGYSVDKRLIREGLLYYEIPKK